MVAMRRTVLALSLLWVLAGTAPASAAFLGQNPRLGESFPNAGVGQAAGDVSRELPPGSGGSCLERPAGCFVAPAAAEGGAGGTVKVFRVEGTPNTRIIIGDGGQVAIQGDRTLFLNFGRPGAAEAFLSQRLSQGMPGATIKSFEVPQSVLTDLQSSAVPESMARQFPNSPIQVDVTKAADQFGLRLDQIPASPTADHPRDRQDGTVKICHPLLKR